MLIGSLRGTAVAAIVADARAFGAHRERTPRREQPTTTADRLAWAALGAVTVAAVLLVARRQPTGGERKFVPPQSWRPGSRCPSARGAGHLRTRRKSTVSPYVRTARLDAPR